VYLPVMIEISGSEDCIDVICAVKYSQSCFANCCIFMWQLAVLLFYNTQKYLLYFTFCHLSLSPCTFWPCSQKHWIPSPDCDKITSRQIAMGL